MRTVPLLSVFVCLAVATVHAALDPASISSPRLSGWVVDQAQVLSADDVAELRRLGDAVRARDGAEMAIVVVPTIGGGDHREFATRLFNRWELGNRTRQNGLLIFVAVGDRSAEIVLGNGIDSDAQVATSDRVMQGEMVPRFRSGDPAGAVLAGARACAREFFGVTVARAAAPDPASLLVEAPARAPSSAPAQAPTAAAPRRSHRSGVGLGVFAGVGAAVVVAIGVGGVVLANRPRRCGRCGMTMQQLDEVADDQHLTAGERLEERLGSVDHVVWMCPGCSAIDKVRSGRWFTRYSRCPQCGQTTSSEKTSTLRSASELFEGLVEIRERCEHCGRAHTYQRSTPRVHRTSSSLGRSGGRSSSGSGGGRSSGRGSSGKW